MQPQKLVPKMAKYAKNIHFLQVLTKLLYFSPTF